jgi:hypothetical protein
MWPLTMLLAIARLPIDAPSFQPMMENSCGSRRCQGLYKLLISDM